jgi:endoglycosylceramidase
MPISANELNTNFPHVVSRRLLTDMRSFVRQRGRIPAVALLPIALMSVVCFLNPAAARCIFSSPNRLCTDKRFFRDHLGRIVLLRGVNIAGTSKVPPFLPLPKFGDRDASPTAYAKNPVTYAFGEHTDLSELDVLPQLGVNVIRLLFNWEAFEPVEGQQNGQYLAMLQSIADAAWARGIFTIIDFHQDVFLRFVAAGCGDGFPGWAIPVTVKRVAAANNESCRLWWSIGNIPPNADADWKHCFVALYEDTAGLQRKYLSVLTTVATRFSGRSGIIGYDPINEPYWGSNEAELKALYPKVASTIRSADASAILFLEPSGLVSMGSQTNITHAPVPSDNITYSPHFYDPTVIFPGVYIDASRSRSAFRQMADIASAWGTPLFVGEYGAPSYALGVGEYMRVLKELLDQFFASGAQWNYTPGWTPQDYDGWNVEDMSIVEANLHPRDQLFLTSMYPQRISGDPLLLKTESSEHARCMMFQWNNDPTLSGETIFLVGRKPGTSVELRINVRGSSIQDLHCSLNDSHLQVTCKSRTPGKAEVTLSYGMPYGACTHH